MLTFKSSLKLLPCIFFLYFVPINFKNFVFWTTLFCSQLITTVLILYRTRGGRKLVDPQTYISCIEALKPDMFQAIADGDTTQRSTDKRVRKSVGKILCIFIL